LFLALGVAFRLERILFPADIRTGLLYFVLCLSVLILILILHELFHFISFKIVGLSPKIVYVRVPGYGGCPGVMPKLGRYMKRSEYITCLITPQIMTVAGIVWLVYYLLATSPTTIHILVFWAIVLNFLGGVADLKSLVFVLRKHTRQTIYVGKTILSTLVYDKVK